MKVGWDCHLFNTLVLPIVPWLSNIVTWVAVESVVKKYVTLVGYLSEFSWIDASDSICLGIGKRVPAWIDICFIDLTTIQITSFIDQLNHWDVDISVIGKSKLSRIGKVRHFQ